MHSVDWFPTILEMADLKNPIQSLDGVSHYESMKSDKSYPRDEVKISLSSLPILSTDLFPRKIALPFNKPALSP